MMALAACAAATALVFASAEGFDCDRQIFEGLDSRARVTPIADVESDLMVAFQLVGKRPVLSLGRRLVAFDEGGRTATVPLLDAAMSLATDAAGELFAHTARGLVRIGSQGPSPIAGRDAMRLVGVAGSGATTLLRTWSAASRYVVDLFDPAREEFVDLVETPVAVRAASWDGTEALLVLADGRLLRWVAASREIQVLANDGGLASARSICRGADGQLILGLQGVTVAVTQGPPLVLATFGALCARSGETVALADPESGLTVRLDDLAGAGFRDRDEDHARRLLDTARGTGPFDARREAFLEASRILGCARATRALAVP